MKDKRAKLHPAICFTMLGHYLDVNIETIIDYYLYQNVSSLTQKCSTCNSLRSNNRTTSCDGDDSIYRAYTTTYSHIKRRRLWFNSPGLELNQMEHENVNVRIFIS